MTRVIRNGKSIDVNTNRLYRCYVHLWCDFYPLRAAILRGKAWVRSVLGAVIIYLMTLWLCNAETRSYLPEWWMYPLLGLLGGFVGQMGDLFASLVKRHCGLKDFSNIFPGHGGMLDRLDSVLFMAVLMYCYRLFFMTV